MKNYRARIVDKILKERLEAKGAVLIEGAHDIIHKYEDESYEICEMCGDVGSLCIRGGWYQTLCKKHMHEKGFNVM